MEECKVMMIAKNIASYLTTISDDDKKTFRTWAKNAKLEDWKEDLLEELKALA